jgi:hypothetical protein
MTGSLHLPSTYGLGVAVFFMLAANAAAQTAGGQTPPLPQKPSETVVVTGRKSAPDIDTIVSQFVELHAAPNRKTGQFMRDDLGPVCPVTLGLPPAFNNFVTARIVAVAASVGAKTDPTGKCTPNVEILFTDQPEAVVKSLAERTRGAILGMHYVHEKPALLQITHPIQGWYLTGTRYDENTSDHVTSYGTDGTAKDANDRTPVIDSAYRRAPERLVLGSNIPLRRVSTIVNVLIVADIKQLGGHEIGPVSDYIAMLALSQPRALDDCNQLPSILDLMSAECSARAKPQALTPSDIAYLNALYAADLGATTISVQKDSITGGMKNRMDSADGNDTPGNRTQVQPATTN